MAEIELKRHNGLVYREVLPEGEPSGPAAVLVHGFPQSSLMWEPAMRALAAAGRRCVAPDLYNLGDSDETAPAGFERDLASLAGLIDALDLGPVALVVHDWGGFIGLAWACEHPNQVEALVISDAGFFADGKWHGMAQAMRSEQGEELVGALDRDGFAGLLRSSGAEFSEAAIDAYWAPFEHGRGRRATLDFYRSMDFEKLAPYDGKLAALGVPTLLIWGADDEFAPLAAAKRFEREIPGARLIAIEGAGHFVVDHDRDRYTRELVAFLDAA
jgi:haloalkane dehalogenase